MATTVSLRKLLDLKRWEMCTSLTSGGLYNGSTIASTQDGLQLLTDGSGGSVQLYNASEDAVGSAGVSGLGSASTNGLQGVYHPSGPTGTASAGTATTITTATNLPGAMPGYTIRITGGTGAGQERVIATCVPGANSVITVTSAWTTNPDNTSTYLLLTGRFWVTTGSALRYYDIATSAWSGAMTTPTAVTSGAKITATPAYGNTFASGTATSATATTLVNSGKAWAASQWINSQVRITGGTGAGQVRTITANTGTTLTVATWTTTPDATSTYAIEGNDDFLYLTGGGAVTLQRYSISGNSWSTLSPGTVRTTAPAGGSSLHWVATTSDSTWADETNIKNGRYLYSFAGGATAIVAYYDIAANVWVNTQTAYRGNPGSFITFTTGDSSCIDREFIYIMILSGTAPGYTYRFNVVTNTLETFTNQPFATHASTGLAGNRICVSNYTDGGTVLRWFYVWPYSSLGGASPGYRMLII